MNPKRRRVPVDPPALSFYRYYKRDSPLQPFIIHVIYLVRKPKGELMEDNRPEWLKKAYHMAESKHLPELQKFLQENPSLQPLHDALTEYFQLDRLWEIDRNYGNSPEYRKWFFEEKPEKLRSIEELAADAETLFQMDQACVLAYPDLQDFGPPYPPEDRYGNVLQGNFLWPYKKWPKPELGDRFVREAENG
jgi:hypothetical protein